MADMTMKQMIEIQEIRGLRKLDDLNGLLEILVFLKKYERGNISNFIKDLRLNQQPVYRTLEKLTDLGIITIKMAPSARRGNFQSKYYYLTDKGEKLGEHILKLFEVHRKM